MGLLLALTVALSPMPPAQALAELAPDTTRGISAPSVGMDRPTPLLAPTADLVESLVALSRGADEVPHERPPAPAAEGDTLARSSFEYSDGYYTRLTIHRAASIATVPLFVAAYLAGEEILSKGVNAPAWARKSHAPLAYTVEGLFAVNTVTGIWNLIEARKDPEGRTKRWVHGLVMLAADAGFAWTATLAPDSATIENRIRRGDTSWTKHKKVATASMALALGGYVMMLLWDQ